VKDRRKHLPPETIITSTNAGEIRNWAERIFATAVAHILHLTVIYEPPSIQANDGSRTQSDFLVTNTKRPKGDDKMYVEVGNGKPNKHKRRQRKVMNESGKPYTQLDGRHIQNIANNYDHGSKSA